jgi:tRNA (guanosine-2'-O-)-methyltransferase
MRDGTRAITSTSHTGEPRRPPGRPFRGARRSELRAQRRPRRHSGWDHLIAAPLWPMHGANLGTLLRTCDAVGACLAVPRYPWVPEALARGNTLRQPSCVHWVGRDMCAWISTQRDRGATIVGVELTDEAISRCLTGWRHQRRYRYRRQGDQTA